MSQYATKRERLAATTLKNMKQILASHDLDVMQFSATEDLNFVLECARLADLESWDKDNTDTDLWEPFSLVLYSRSKKDGVYLQSCTFDLSYYSPTDFSKCEARFLSDIDTFIDIATDLA